jgi:hypothetical protein
VQASWYMQGVGTSYILHLSRSQDRILEAEHNAASVHCYWRSGGLISRLVPSRNWIYVMNVKS